MTERERFIETVLFGKPDKIPFTPGWPRESTLKRWHKEGLPSERDWYEFLLEILGIKPESVGQIENIDISFQMIPKFEEKVLEHKNGHYLIQDWMGAIVEISDEYDYTYIQQAKDFVTRKWHKFPVENQSDWEKMKLRYNPDDPYRLSKDFSEKCSRIRNRDYLFSIGFAGPFWQLREWCGFENLCIFMAEQPDFVLEMINFWKDFVAKMLTTILTEIIPDRVLISEDMAYKEKSMISPDMVKEFLLPSWQFWLDIIKKSGCPVIEMDSDGYIGELIPLWIEAGFNVCTPIEIAAGNDLIVYRKRFGKKMAYRGGIDKRLIAKGGLVLEKEINRVVSFLLKDGGYIPMCDHGVPSDISWNNFVEYSRLLAKLTSWL
jgi:uroporphyrinogen decarboxylase